MLHIALTERKLDRALCNDSWVDFWSSTSCSTLTRIKSDHHPLFMCMKTDTPYFPKPFKFQSMWLHHNDCRRLVLDTWSKEFYGCPMSILFQKLKAVKLAFKAWNKEVFGDVHTLVKAAKPKLDGIQQEIADFGYTNDLDVKEKQAQCQFQKALAFEEEFWRDKARIKWFTQGDRNTTLFHKIAKIRQVTNQMNVLKNGDLILENQQDIEEHVLAYYESLYASENTCSESDFFF